jgi:hypothetical protein
LGKLRLSSILGHRAWGRIPGDRAIAERSLARSGTWGAMVAGTPSLARVSIRPRKASRRPRLAPEWVPPGVLRLIIPLAGPQACGAALALGARRPGFGAGLPADRPYPRPARHALEHGHRGAQRGSFP